MKKFIRISLYIMFLSSSFAWIIMQHLSFLFLSGNLIGLSLCCCYSCFLIDKYQNRLNEDNVKIAVLLPPALYGLLTWIISLCVLF